MQISIGPDVLIEILAADEAELMLLSDKSWLFLARWTIAQCGQSAE